MSDDAALRSCLVWLAAAMVAAGLYTQSLKKVAATYLFGIFVIGGVVLPDWDFFDRSVSQWCTPLAFDQSSPSSTPNRFKLYPMRLVVYAAVYGFAFSKWWKFMISS